MRAVGAGGTASTVALSGCTGGGGGDDGSTGKIVDDPEDLESGIDGKTTVTIYTGPDVGDNSEAIKSALHDAGLTDDVSVKIEAGDRDSGARQDQISGVLDAGRSSPDIMLMDSGWTIPFIARQQLTDVEANLPQATVDKVDQKYFDVAVDTATNRDGVLHAVPMFPDFPTMQYRKDLVEQAGYDPEGENWATESMSWKEFSQMIADVQENAGTEYGFTFQAKAYEGLSCCDFNEFMTSFGGAYFGGVDNLYGPIGDRPITVEEEQVLQSIRMVRTFIHGSDDPESLDGYAGGIAPASVLQWAEEDSRGPFTSGDAVAHRNWPYSIGINGADPAESEDGAGFGENLGVMPIPYGVPADEAKYDGTGGPVAALGGWHLAVNPETENPNAAFAVLDAFTKDNVQLTIFEEIGWVPPQPELFKSDRAQQVPVLGRYLDALQIAGENAVARPVTAVWPSQSTKVYQEVHDAYGRNKSPQQAMSDLAGQLEQIENQY